MCTSTEAHLCACSASTPRVCRAMPHHHVLRMCVCVCVVHASSSVLPCRRPGPRIPDQFHYGFALRAKR